MFDDEKGAVLWKMMKLMHRVHNLFHVRLLQIGLYRGQPPILHFLCAQGSMSQKNLAEKLGLSPATMTATLKRMEKAGLVRRDTDPDDQRVQIVSATPFGRQRNDEARAILADVCGMCLSDMTEEEMLAMENSIAHISANLDKISGAELPYFLE